MPQTVETDLKLPRVDGIVASVIAQCLTGKWDDAGGEEHACRTGAEALRILQNWDEKKAREKKRYYFPGMQD
jgi:hypothetical protein